MSKSDISLISTCLCQGYLKAIIQIKSYNHIDTNHIIRSNPYNTLISLVSIYVVSILAYLEYTHCISNSVKAVAWSCLTSAWINWKLVFGCYHFVAFSYFFYSMLRQQTDTTILDLVISPMMRVARFTSTLCQSNDLHEI